MVETYQTLPAIYGTNLYLLLAQERRLLPPRYPYLLVYQSLNFLMYVASSCQKNIFVVLFGQNPYILAVLSYPLIAENWLILPEQRVCHFHYLRLVLINLRVKYLARLVSNHGMYRGSSVLDIPNNIPNT